LLHANQSARSTPERRLNGQWLYLAKQQSRSFEQAAGEEPYEQNEKGEAVKNFIEWSDSMSVSNPAIDRDHKMLIQYINEMHAAMSAGKGKEHLGAILGKLVKYTQEHFGREEIIWKAGHYAEFNKHKQQHVDLLHTVADFKGKFDSGALALSLDVMNFLRDWLTNHILKSDKAAAAAIAG
jgi:hemerythrin-like metal-binding protein